MSLKIAKYLAECGIASRRKSEELVSQGLVFVNGKKNTNVALRIDPQIDKVQYQGKLIKPRNFVYYLLNKPLGYTSTVLDKHAEKLVTELVPGDPPVWPVGRLDKYTSGLILLTNDGQLTQKITHPGFCVKKEYEVTTNYRLSDQEIGAIQKGTRLEDGFIKPDSFKEISPGIYRIVIHSGKKRVVRRIIEKTGKSVSRLERIRIGSLILDALPPGKWRPLSKQEIEMIKSGASK